MSEAALLDELRRRFPTEGTIPFNGMDYVHAIGSPLEAWMYSNLLWPAFFEYEGMVFLRDVVEDEGDLKRVREALAHYQGDKRVTQLSFNTFEIGELFGRRTGDTTAEQDAFFAETLAAMWRAKLQLAFPDRKCHVAVEPPGGVAGVAVVFHME